MQTVVDYFTSNTIIIIGSGQRWSGGGRFGVNSRTGCHQKTWTFLGAIVGLTRSYSSQKFPVFWGTPCRTKLFFWHEGGGLIVNWATCQTFRFDTPLVVSLWEVGINIRMYV